MILSVGGGGIMKGIKWTNEKVNETLKEWGISPIKIDYNGHATKFTFKCRLCGREQTTNLKDRKRVDMEKKSWCGVCCSHKNVRWKCSYEEVKTRAKQNNLELISPKEDYQNSASKLKYKCSCGKIFTTSPKQITKGKCRCNECEYELKCGENNYLYDNNKSAKERDRERGRIRKWRQEVYKRDNYTCQRCHTKGGDLNAHHINGYSWDKSNRINVDNGITLCERCHKEYHKEYGYFNTNATDFIEFIKFHANTEVMERIKELSTP